MVAAIGLCWLLTSAPAVAAETTVDIVHPGAVGRSALPLAIAHEHGLFRKHGIDARLVAVAEAERLGVTDEHPIGLFGAPVALRQAAQGKDVKIVATVATARLSGHLVARPGIRTPQDLRGKRLGVFGIGAGLWINTMLALEHLSLDPNRDKIIIVDIGDLIRIVQALEAGTIDAAVVSPAQSAQLRAKGFSVLLDLYPANLSGPQPALVVTGTYLRERPVVVEAVLLALVEGVAFSLAPNNKSAVLQTFGKTFGIADPLAAERGYQDFLRSMIRKPYPSIGSLRNMQRIIALHDAAVLNVKPGEIVDDRLVRKLDEGGAIDGLYAAYGVK
jgi:ABC-type nitrate/sulfonate/bicarbonate transport system substrate-binding protein